MHFNRKLGTFKVRRMNGLSILTRDQALFSFLGRQGETKRKFRCNVSNFEWLFWQMSNNYQSGQQSS